MLDFLFRKEHSTCQSYCCEMLGNSIKGLRKSLEEASQKMLLYQPVKLWISTYSQKVVLILQDMFNSK